jgi:nicotinamidase-related amidase
LEKKKLGATAGAELAPESHKYTILGRTENSTMNSALLIIDLQNDYFPGGCLELVGIEPAAQRAQELLWAFRQSGQPIFHVQHMALGPDATFFRPDTPGVEIHRMLQPRPGEPVVQKHFPNSFRETGLLEALQQAGIAGLVICGAMSHMCIDATTRAAFDYGLRCQVIHDACATRNLVFESLEVSAPQVHAAFMAALRARYAQVLSLEEFFATSTLKLKV